MIPQETISDIKFRNPIEDVVGSYVTLRRGGATMKGLCPFHSEKTPSFTVFTATQDFHCFGCGAGGDVISFVMRMENLEYVEAIRFLAKRAGITIPEDEKKEQRGTTRARVIEMNTAAAKYFHACLADEQLGAPGRAYFEKRQLSGATIRHFGLGYAPADFTGLYKHLRAAGYRDEEIVAANLGARSQKTGKIYDVFRGRVMFPIIDVSGNVVAFGGRVLDDSQPKYLNTSDTPAFRKSRNLFALNFARKHCEERLILCEGYMDVIALHAAGFENAVATLGTAITPEHARIFKRYSPKCVISYDADAAGQRAADTAFRLLEEAGVEVRLLKVYDAKDPDEFIKKFGADAFARLLGEARSQFDFKLSGVLQKYNVTDPGEKVKAITEISSFVAGMYSAVEREIYVGKIAEKFSVSRENVARDVENMIRRRQNAEKKKHTGDLITKTSGIGDRVNLDFAKVPKLARLEETVIGIMLLRTEYIREAPGLGLSADSFGTDLGRRLYSFISASTENGTFDFGMLNEAFTPEEVSRASAMLCERKKLSDNGSAVFEETVRLLLAEKQRLDDAKSGSDPLDLIGRRRAAAQKADTK